MSRRSDTYVTVHLCQPARIRVLMYRLTVLAAVVVLAAGCADSKAPETRLQGVVTLNGKQIPSDAKAFVNFAPAAGGTAKSVSVEVIDGHYDSPHTPQGPVLVSFAISRAVGPEKKSDRTGQLYHDIENMVPARYSTGIKLEVEGDNPNQDFHLTE